MAAARFGWKSRVEARPRFRYERYINSSDWKRNIDSLIDSFLRNPPMYILILVENSIPGVRNWPLGIPTVIQLEMVKLALLGPG